MGKMCLRDLATDDLAGKTAIVRADLNAPLEGGIVRDDARLVASVPTLKFLLDAGAGVVLLSHLGRPGGTEDLRFSLGPVSDRLSELLGRRVRFHRGALDDSAARADSSEVVLLENTRFSPGETANTSELSAAYASLGDLFVNDAFGAAHRAHASTEGVARAITGGGGYAVAGLLLERELEVLGSSLADPERPFVAIIGGAKISGKIDVIESLLPRVDRLLIGGAMANTFFLAMGLEVGSSLVEEDRVDMALELMELAGERLILPVDCVVTREIAEGADAVARARTAVGAGEKIADIGPETGRLFAADVAAARTVLWNGPMGVFEVPPFNAGTLFVASAVADASDSDALTVVGGGDSVRAIHEAGVSDRIGHISTGGGASLELLSGKKLPAVEALTDRV